LETSFPPFRALFPYDSLRRLGGEDEEVWVQALGKSIVPVGKSIVPRSFREARLST